MEELFAEARAGEEVRVECGYYEYEFEMIE